MAELTDDISLLVAFKAGRSWAEKRVFDLYFEPLCLFVERITGDLAAAEDIAMEALTKVIDRRADFAVLPKLGGFLYQSARNAALNWIDSRKRHSMIEERAQLADSARAGGDPELEVMRAELLAEIYREVENLPEKCGQIFKLIFVEDLSTAEIAERLGISAQTVRSQKARAVELLKTALLKKGRMSALIFLLTWVQWRG